MSNVTVYKFEINDAHNDPIKKLSRWAMYRHHPINVRAAL